MPTERSPAERCRWASQADALAAFAEFTGATQSAGHIKPLHWYVACRLVVEGGFHPDDVTPRPPFRVERVGGKGRLPLLVFEPAAARGGERTILGGLKTKNVDVVVTRDGIGPVLAVSCKGVTGAFRNLTNRMEETIGECTNLHITYPALVLGYLVLLRANRQVEGVLTQIASPEEAESGRGIGANDVALRDDGAPVAGIVRFHDALRELVGRRGIRNDVSRYESIGLGLVSMVAGERGALVDAFPDQDSELRLERFFSTLYTQYDERYVTRAPDLASGTRRLAWEASSPGLALEGLDYEPRVGGAR